MKRIEELYGITKENKLQKFDESEKIPSDILNLADHIMSLNPDQRKIVLEKLNLLLSQQNTKEKQN